VRHGMLLALVVLFSQMGCAPTSGPAPIGTGPVQVLATTSIIADAVSRIGGEAVQVKTLMPPGTDPHTYLPSPGDAQQLSQAQIIFYNGLHLEGKMAQLLEKHPGGGRAVAVSERLDPVKDLRTVDNSETSHDPHVWFDVQLWSKCVERIRDELIDADPARSDLYRKNSDRYLAELSQLHQEMKKLAEKVPTSKRVLVTSHDAFGYWEKAYGFEVRGLQGVSTAAALSSKDREGLAKFLGQRKIPVVFCETSVPSKGLKAVLDTTQESYKHQVKLIGEEEALYSDSLGGPGSPGETYIGMVRHNMQTVVKHLMK
jgi:manganese/zinc/iron transport system substrate-binding protein